MMTPRKAILPESTDKAFTSPPSLMALIHASKEVMIEKSDNEGPLKWK